MRNTVVVAAIWAAGVLLILSALWSWFGWQVATAVGGLVLVAVSIVLAADES